ncbi:MAG TPA: FHA domain-containing protein [Acidimicrobiales bacterium]|nr:FHA domain-containing protein [Acidimicrobiales bacterium]
MSSVSGVFCNQCGHRNPAGSNFCSSCGAALEPGEDHTVTFQAVEAPGEPAAEDALTVSVGELPEGLGMLVVKRGPNAGSKYVLDADVTTAGRHPDSDIFLDDITVSRRHAEFLRDGGSYRVRDVGSLNGTYVNRERTDDAVLAHGDEVQIGKFKLVFFSGGEA